MKGLAEVSVTQQAGIPVVRLDGEVDLSNIEEVRHAMFAPAEAGHSCVVVDLTGTTYLDSTAVRLLFDLAVRYALANELADIYPVFAQKALRTACARLRQ